MSRHRNIRSMNYDEEYEGYDDVYGHSVEDDYATSPSMEHFMYDRNREQQMSSFLTTEADIIEEDEEESPENAGKVKASLSEIDQARVNSCLDQIRDIMGESIPESEITRAILAHNFSTAAAMSALLDKSSTSQPPKPKGDTLAETPTAVRPSVREPVLPLPKKDHTKPVSLSDLIKSRQQNAKTPDCPVKLSLGELAKTRLAKPGDPPPCTEPFKLSTLAQNLPSSSPKVSNPPLGLKLSELSKLRLDRKPELIAQDPCGGMKGTRPPAPQNLKLGDLAKLKKAAENPLNHISSEMKTPLAPKLRLEPELPPPTVTSIPPSFLARFFYSIASIPPPRTRPLVQVPPLSNAQAVVPFNFDSPSPDDIVLQKRSQIPGRVNL